MDPKPTKVNFSGKNVVFSKENLPNTIKTPENSFYIDKITSDFNKVIISSKVSSAHKKFDQFSKHFVDEIIKMDLIQKNTDAIFNFLDELIEQFALLLTETMNSNLSTSDVKKVVADNISNVSGRIRQQMSANNTQYKRNKLQKQNISFVAPEEKAIGLKWIEKSTAEKVIPKHQLTQTTLQYISIFKTLKSLFQQEDFKTMYFEYNSQKHVCVYIHCNVKIYENSRSKIYPSIYDFYI